MLQKQWWVYFLLTIAKICLSIYVCIYLGDSADGGVKVGELCLLASGLGSDLENVCCALFIWSRSSPDFNCGFMCTKLLQWKSLVLTSAFLYLSGSSILTSASQIYSCWMEGAQKRKGCCWCLGRHVYFKHLLPRDNSGVHRKLLEMGALSRKEQCRGPFRR